MKNSKLLLLSLFASAMVFGFSSCKDNNMKKNDTPSVVDDTSLTFMVSSDSPDYLYGDVVTYTIQPMNGDKAVAAAADANIRVTFTGTATMEDGSSKSVTASDVFDNYQENTSIKKGATSAVVKYTIKSGLTYKSIVGTFSAFSRGNNFKSSDVKVNIYKNYEAVVSIKGQSDLSAVKLQGNAKFQITLTLPKPAKSEVVVNLKTDVPNQFEGLPETLTIAQGQTTVTSPEIMVKPITEVTSQDVTAMITLKSNNATYPTNITSIKVIVENPNKGLGDQLKDERWVYKNPDEVFVSKANQAAVEKVMGGTHQYQLMQVGDPSPNKTLAAEGWKFLNSMEFSPIPALIAPWGNKYGNNYPNFFADQAVKGNQEYQAVDGTKYSTITNSGYMMIWSAYEPQGIKTRGEYAGQNRQYGAGGLYANKFDGNPSGADKWAPQNVLILPGTRVEVRLKMAGDIYGFNPAVWFIGNKFRTDQWSYYGEVDLLEAPQSSKGPSTGSNGPWQTFHWSNDNTKAVDQHNPNSGELNVDIHKFNIYWFEWRSNDELAMGINGKTTKVIKKSEFSGHWPFDSSYNPNGLCLLITFPAHSDVWGQNNPAFNTSWDQYLKQISYDGSKTNPNTPRMEFDWIRYYYNSNYNYDTQKTKMRNTPMY